MTHINLWLPKDLLLKAKENGFNLSRLLKRVIITELEKKGITVDIITPELIIKVKCPNCGNIQPTTSVNRIRCFNCEKVFSIYVKHGKVTKSHIVDIIKGSTLLLHKKYYEKYRKKKRLLTLSRYNTGYNTA